MNKKGVASIGELPNLAVVLLLTAIFFVIGIVILSSFQTNNTGVTTNSVVNESITMPSVANGKVTLAHTHLVAISSVTNKTNASAPYAAANYSIYNAALGQVNFVSNTSATPYCAKGGSCFITYTYQTFDETPASVALNNTIDALGEIPNNWLLLVVVIIAASILIGIVISNLGGNMSRR